MTELNLEINGFASNDALRPALTEFIGSKLDQALAKSGKSSIALSGGHTPGLLYRDMSSLPLEWQHIHVTLVDERWVPDSDPASNARLVKENLLQGNAAAAKFTGLYDGSADPLHAEIAINKQLQKLPLPLDIVVLGMGEDGHTASWFPGSAQLPGLLDPQNPLLCSAATAPAEPCQRMTLTLSMVMNSRQLVLYIVGRRKWEVLQTAMESGSPETLPVRAVLQQNRVPLQIYYAAR